MSRQADPNELTLRPAQATDLAFIVEAIIAAEKSGTDRLSYCTLFGLQEAEFRTLLAEILEEDIAGQELCISGFLIAERDGQPAGAACSWVEGKGARSSAILKGTLLAHAFGRERIASSAARLELVAPLTMTRDPGALQIESVYVAESWRGRGIVRAVLEEHIRRALKRDTPPSSCQIIIAASNELALRSYARCGFTATLTRSSDDPALAQLLPATARTMMVRRLN